MAGIIKLNNIKRTHAKLLIAAACLVLLIGAAVYTAGIRPLMDKDTYVYKAETVQRGELTLGIMESGTVSMEESTLDYTLKLLSDDEEDEEDDDSDEEDSVRYLEIEKVYAVNGQRIAAGDALFKLTENSVKAVERRLSGLEAEARIALAEAQNEYSSGLLAAKSAYDSSLLEAGGAQEQKAASDTRLNESVNRLFADIEVLEAEIVYNEKQLANEELWEQLADAQTEYDAAGNIFEETDVHNATAYTSNYSSYKTAKEQLEDIQERIDGLKESIEDARQSIEEKQREIAVRQAAMKTGEIESEGVYESAVLGGELAKEIYNYTVEGLEESLSAAQTELEEAEEELDKFHEFVGGDGIIYAENSGLVTNVSYEEGDKLTEEGTMLSYVQENAYTVTIDVSEEDVSAIRVGDRVAVGLTAYPDTIWQGEVSEIITTAAADYASTVSYPVTITIVESGDTALFYGGMTADITFVTDSATDVLYVSKKAVQTIDGKSYVYMEGRSGEKELTEVETGFSDGTNLEIVSGLKEGDTVYIRSRISGEESELTQTETERTRTKTEQPQTEAGREESSGPVSEENVQPFPTGNR